MATTHLLAVEEYLRTSYRPDCDYVDGLVIERNLGQFDHARLQCLILMSLGSRETEWRILVMPEQRLKIGDRKYRVPDVMVIAEDAPRTPVIEVPPLLCIEIVSPDDRLRNLTERALDYLQLGVPETWILDPAEKRAYIYSAAGLHEAPAGSVLRAGNIEMDLGIFDKL